ISNHRDPNVGNITSIQTTDQQGAGYTINATNRANTAGIDVTLSDIDGDTGQNTINMDRNGNAINYFSAYSGQNTDSFGRNPFPVRQGDRQTDPNHIYVVGSDGSTQTYTLTYSTYSVIAPPNPAGTTTFYPASPGRTERTASHMT